MMNKFVSRGKSIIFSEQQSILSAAAIIAFMFFISSVLGFVRQRVILNFFDTSQTSLLFAAFRFPDLIFEVLVFGTFSSSFVPVFTKLLKKGPDDAWRVASQVINMGVLLFLPLAGLIAIFAYNFYSLAAPGFSNEETAQIATIARILLVAQGFFVVSYVMTGVLESLRRFLVPALAPVFYNLGVILGTIFLTPHLGLMAPAVGMVIGAACHLLIQLPLAIKLGFRYKPDLSVSPEVKEIAKLSGPRLVDLSFEQVQKTVELFLASLISTASYTYFTLASSLRVLPISLFSSSLAKAAFPTLAREREDLPAFRKTLFATLYQIVFFVAPIAVLLIVLRVPVIRLLYGTKKFDWEATVQTGMVLSAFAVGTFFQAMVLLLERGFYALHDTKTPVVVSLITIALIIVLNFVMVREMGLPVWALAASFSVGVGVQLVALFVLMHKKIGNIISAGSFVPILKNTTAAVVSGMVVYFLLKFFDRSVWIKRLSFIPNIDALEGLDFRYFVLDTRYTVNLLILTLAVALVGGCVYLLTCYALKSSELASFMRVLAARRFPAPKKDSEAITPPPLDTN